MGELTPLTIVAGFIILFELIILGTVFYLAFSTPLPITELLQEIKESAILSVETSLITTTIVLMISIPIAYWFSRQDLKGKQALRALLGIPYILSPSASGLILLIFFVRNPFGKILNESLGIVNDFNGIVLAQCFLAFPIALIYFTALFKTIPQSLEEVARTLGYGRVEALYRIFLPSLKPQVVSGALLVFARAFGDFGASLILGGGIRGRTVTLPIALYFVNQYGDIILVAYALSSYVLLAYLILFLTSILER
uniref:ABC transporter permease subunit n=1 Tax=Thermosphaera aggregans TaxID=54254 RepID=A0A7C2BJY7_9CREN